MNNAPTVLKLIESRARADSTMLIHCDVPLSFAAILDESRRLATGLARLGVKRGDRVAIWLPTFIQRAAPPLHAPGPKPVPGLLAKADTETLSYSHAIQPHEPRHSCHNFTIS